MTKKIPWTSVRIHAVGGGAPLPAGPQPVTIRQWAEGDRSKVERVTDAANRELAPEEIDWSGMEPVPTIGPPQPPTLDLRDHFAIAALHTLDDSEPLRLATKAYAIADAMLKVRSKGRPE